MRRGAGNNRRRINQQQDHSADYNTVRYRFLTVAQVRALNEISQSNNAPTRYHLGRRQGQNRTDGDDIISAIKVPPRTYRHLMNELRSRGYSAEANVPITYVQAEPDSSRSRSHHADANVVIASSSEDDDELSGSERHNSSISSSDDDAHVNDNNDDRAVDIISSSSTSNSGDDAEINHERQVHAVDAGSDSPSPSSDDNAADDHESTEQFRYVHYKNN